MIHLYESFRFRRSQRLLGPLFVLFLILAAAGCEAGVALGPTGEAVLGEGVEGPQACQISQVEKEGGDREKGAEERGRNWGNGDGDSWPIGVTVTNGPETLAVGETVQLETVVVNPEEELEPTVHWRSSAPEVARVSEDGLLEGLCRGVATIEARVGRFTDEFQVTVEDGEGASVLADLTAELGTPASVVLGGTLDVTTRVRNVGQAASGEAHLRLRVMDASSGAEVRNVRLPIPPLAPGAVTEMVESIPVDGGWPAAAVVDGMADVDDAVMESDESNNHAVSPEVPLMAPDLVVGAVAVPSSLGGRCTLDVQVDVQNAGDAPAGATDLRIFLSDAGTGADFLDATIPQAALGPGEGVTLSKAFPSDDTWPAELSVRAETDPGSAVMEGREDNNDGSAGSPVQTLLAPPAGHSHVWSCGPTDRWDDPANWIPGSVPGSGADVYVPAGTAMSPVLAVDRQIRSLTVEDGARVEIQDRVLTVAGSVRGGRIASGSGGGLLVLTGASAELSGDLPALSVLGSVALAADSRAEGDVTVSPGATLGLAGHGLTVAGDLAATATAPDGSTGVQLHGPGDRLVVEGAATFAHQGSGTSEGGLTAGTVVVRGDFDAASDFGFVSTGTHTVLDGSAVQTVHSLGRRQPGQNQFWGLDLANASGVVFLSSVNAMGDGVWDGRVEVRSGRAVKVFGLLTLESGMFLKNDGFVMYGTLDDRGATVQGNAPFAIP